MLYKQGFGVGVPLTPVMCLTNNYSGYGIQSKKECLGHQKAPLFMHFRMYQLWKEGHQPSITAHLVDLLKGGNSASLNWVICKVTTGLFALHVPSFSTPAMLMEIWNCIVTVHLEDKGGNHIMKIFLLPTRGMLIVTWTKYMQSSPNLRSWGAHYWACYCLESKQNQWHGTESVKRIHTGR